MADELATRDAVSLGEVVEVIEHLAPPSWAESWDNVGLLIEARPPNEVVRRLLLTIDLTRPVLNEAIAQNTDLVIAYHPPIFKGLKSLTSADPRGSMLLDAIRYGISVYSPHTARDATPGGVGDWRAAGGGAAASSRPVTQPRDLDPALVGKVGGGRVLRLAEPADLDTLVGRLKDHLRLDRVRVAAASAHARGQANIQQIAICPGAGGGLFEKLDGCDLYVTGEMRHHDVLARVEGGASVILTDHTNTERGYLPTLRRMLRDALGRAVQVEISRRDRDPLQIV